ncbi:MAG: EAL domain-containing protein [Rhodocyclaceae bacterium]|jgi:diguanylate cyclase (GGDEF)-like protein/PAS domain S-box-containing protein|nr:EAL domain-containing protein [Rhodocyclaceae bacterium]
MAWLRLLWGRLSLIGQLMVTASVALVVSGVAMVWVSANQEAAEIRSDLRAELEQELDTLPPTLAEMAVVGDLAALQHTLAAYVTRPLVAAVEFRDEGGINLRSQGSPLPASVPNWFLALYGLEDISGSTPIVVGGRTYGELRITLTPQGLADRAWRHLSRRMAVLALALALDFIGIWLVLRLGLRPLKQLRAGADAIAAGQLDIQLELHGSPELRRVQESFVRMAVGLRETQASLARSEDRLRLAFQGTNEGLWDWDLRDNSVYFSPRWKEILGYADDELPNVFASFEDNLHPEDKARVFQAVDDYLAGRLPVYAPEFRMGHKDGSWRWILARGEALWDDQGVPYRMAGAHADLTESKRAEEKLKLAASVFAHAREGIAITDGAGTILDVNDAFCRTTGYQREELVGANPRILQSGRQPPEFYAGMWRQLLEKGHWTGEIWNRRKSGEVFPELLTISAVKDETGDIFNFVALFTDITPIKAHEAELEHIAHFDALTNLPNRVLLADRLGQALAQCQRRGKSVAVAYLDLDGFKAVNDQYGHDVGDELLVALAHRMKDALRDGDTLARMGGDEFVAVLVDLGEASDCEPVLSRLLKAAATPVHAGGCALEVSASMGVTLYPEDGGDADQLLRHADQAMYVAKQAGKNRYHLFDVVQDAAVKTRRESLERIGLAVEQDELVLYYQPKVNMRTGQLMGVEALIRWLHPERGLLPPAAFLPMIEGHALELEIGNWVLGSAMVQMARWQTEGLNIPVSVNISAYQLQQADFVSNLQAKVAAYCGAGPCSLELEVLETSALEDMHHVTEVLAACRGVGISVALDDFGTGYSSLTYLKRLPADVLKIDQSFVRGMLDDPQELAIVEGVIGLAAAFRRTVIAEGVETMAHGEMLLRLGCELAQGYGIARPMPASELPGWLATWKPWGAWQQWQHIGRARWDLPLIFAEVEHQHWVHDLALFIEGGRDAPPVLDEYQCRYGRWHYQEGMARFGAAPRFVEVTRLHKRIHELGQALVALCLAGRHGEARVRMGELSALRDQLVEGLQELGGAKAKETLTC